jgi:hypothetical protein
MEPSLPKGKRYRLIAEVLYDDGKPMVRIYDEIKPGPPRKRPNYGKNWPAVRDAIVKRDGGVCVECGSDFRVQVHHIRPLRLFGEDLQAANLPSNLVTLCFYCHRDADADLRSKEGGQ